MVEHQIEEEIDIYLFLKSFYKKRFLVFRVLILAIVLSLIYSYSSFLLRPPLYKYTSQSVIDMTISEGAEYQKPMFISYLSGQKIFDESAKSIGLEANYASWRNSMTVEDIRDSSQIMFKLSANTSDKLIELNRRIVSNAIFQSSNILTGLNIQTIEEAELLEDVQEIRGNVDYFGNIFMFSVLGLMGIFGWLALQVFTDRRVKRVRDIERFTNLSVIGTIPDFTNLSVSEDINLRNFLRGLIWKNQK